MGCIGAIILGIISLMVETVFVWAGLNIIIWLLGLIGFAIAFTVSFKVAFILTLILWIIKLIF